MSDAQLNDFLKKKLTRVFKTFFDINNDGVIEWEDFEIAVEKIRKLRHWVRDDDSHRSALQTMRLIWDGLQKYADDNQDGKITKDEWFRMWTESGKASNDQAGLPEWQQHYMDFMFSVNDTSGDQRIDKDEYTIVYTSYGLSKEECERAFDTFATTDAVDQEEFSRLWKEYFTSSDQSCRGNFLFGMIE